MIDEKAKEKINDILNKDFNLTPKQIAEAYLTDIKWKEKFNKNIIPEKSILYPLFFRKTRLPALFIELLDRIKKLNKPIPKGYNELNTLFTVVSKNNLKTCVDQLSKKTRKQLEDNYDIPTIKKVVEAIIDFEEPIRISIMAKKTINALTKIANKCSGKQKTVLIEACNILAGGAPLSTHEREIIRAIKFRLESPTYIKMTPLKELELCNCLYPLSPIPSRVKNLTDIMHWLNMSRSSHPDLESLAYMLQFNYKSKRGSPRGIIYVAFQEVIYSLLAKEAQPKKVKEHGSKKWVQKLSARIINESYKRYLKNLPKLTEKDINNAIHLKNDY